MKSILKEYMPAELKKLSELTKKFAGSMCFVVYR